MIVLHIACLEARLDFILYILQIEKLDASSRTITKNIALHYLVRHAFEETEERDKFEKIVGIFIKKGVDINAQNEPSLETSLHYACVRGTLYNPTQPPKCALPELGRVQTASILLSFDAKVDLKNR